MCAHRNVGSLGGQAQETTIGWFFVGEQTSGTDLHCLLGRLCVL